MARAERCGGGEGGLSPLSQVLSASLRLAERRARELLFPPEVTTPASPEALCESPLTLESFTHVCLLPALLLVCFFSFTQRRARLHRCCDGRPALLAPTNLLGGPQDRLALAAAFGSTASSCLALFSEQYVPHGSSSWAKPLYAMLAVVEMGINYYPFFICINGGASLLHSVIGFCYAAVWLAVSGSYALACFSRSKWGFPGESLVIQLPALACMLCLLIVFAKNFAKACCIRLGDKKKVNVQVVDEIGDHSEPVYVKRVRSLLKGERSMLPQFSRDYLRSASYDHLTSYKKDQTFTYSPRIIAIAVVSVICLYEFSLLNFLGVRSGLQYASNTLESKRSTLIQLGLHSGLLQLINVSTICWYIAFGTASATVIIYIVQTVVNYRRHMLRLYRGDHTFLPKTRLSSRADLILSHSFMYAGTQIAYILWGYYILILFIFVIGLALAYFLFLPLLGLVSLTWLKPLWNLAPAIVVSYIIYWIQTLLSRKVMLQPYTFTNKKGKQQQSLALNNRKLFHNFTYFLFFFHILLGIYTCLARIFKGMIFGVVYLARLDKCSLAKGFEKWDSGYMSYVAFLQLELYHTHPVLLTFCKMMNDSIAGLNSVGPYTVSPYGSLSVARELQQRRVRNRWLKAYTLLSNPALRNSPVIGDFSRSRSGTLVD